MKSPEELRKLRDQEKESLENSYWAVEQSREDGDPPTTALRGISHKTLMIAIAELALGNVRESRQWFARSAISNLSIVRLCTQRWNDLSVGSKKACGPRALAAIETAVISGADQMISLAAETIRTLNEDLPAEFAGTGEQYWKACTVGCLATGALDQAQTYRDRYSSFEDDKHTSALLQTHDGLITDDPDLVQTGIQRIVDYHETVVDEMHRWDALMSRAAAAHLLIARSHHMKITIESAYLPDALETYEIGDHLTIPMPDYAEDDVLPNS